MISFRINEANYAKVTFIKEEKEAILSPISLSFKGEIKTSLVTTNQESVCLHIGIGKEEILEPNQLREIGAYILKEMKKLGQDTFSIDCATLGYPSYSKWLGELVEGLVLGTYELPAYKKERKEQKQWTISLEGIEKEDEKDVLSMISEIVNLTQCVLNARDLVNAPGNKLRPFQFVKEIEIIFKDTDVEVEVLDEMQLKEIKMEALLSVGTSSAYSPYLVVLKYKNNPDTEECMGLVGKGVTCDTGGYCLKPASSMLGIKGDMAGAAAIIETVNALQLNRKKTNVVACIPICENRISKSSLLPGDVINAYDGSTIEILNTDAEGRLILADALSYLIQKEKVSQVLDIATLTGAVVGLLGFSIAGVLCDSEILWKKFEQSAKKAGERYLRIPFYEEHEKMIKSHVADIKNMGESYCGTITAGVFIRYFAKETPWIHLDIAGTAWVDNPVFEYQSKGATGAGITSIYYLCQ